LILGFWWCFRDALTLASLAARENQLREYQSAHPWLVLGMAFAIYVLVTGTSLPGAGALSLVYGWYFGFLPGVALVSFASTAGATVAMLSSRYFLGDWVRQRWGNRLGPVLQAMDQEGPYYLFTLRLIPAIPFFLINLALGLTKIRVWTFWWVSQLGMLPGTLVYLYAGSRVPSLRQLSDQGIQAVFSSDQLIQLLLACAALGLAPLLFRRLLGGSRKPQGHDDRAQ
jgi:uncharacterized membrane protein YdjX (TVP38/TMEM64 family)